MTYISIEIETVMVIPIHGSVAVVRVRIDNLRTQTLSSQQAMPEPVPDNRS